MNIFENFFLEEKKKKILFFCFLWIFTSIFDDSSNFWICFLNISFISSIVNRSLFDEGSLSKEVGVEIDDDEQGGGAVKTFEAKIKIRSNEMNRLEFIRLFVAVKSWFVYGTRLLSKTRFVDILSDNARLAGGSFQPSRLDGLFDEFIWISQGKQNYNQDQEWI